MLYLAYGSSKELQQSDSLYLGQALHVRSTPDQCRAAEAQRWAFFDNPTRPFDELRYKRWLFRLQKRFAGVVGLCLFVESPAQPGEPQVTRHLFDWWSLFIRKLGFPIGFVAQPGVESATIPWKNFDALILEGPAAWIDSVEVNVLAGEATDRCKRLHLSHVDSQVRVRRAWELRADSVSSSFFQRFKSASALSLLDYVERYHEEAQRRLF